MTEAQNIAFAQIRAVLERWKHSPNYEGFRLALGEVGFVVAVRRVTWSGGVGSFREMRGGIVRVQVRASTWGYSSSGGFSSSGGAVLRSSSMGFKYAPCVEILENGKCNFGGYYNTSQEPQRFNKHLKLRHHSKRKTF